MKNKALLLVAIATASLAHAQEQGITIGGAGAFTGGVSFIDETGYPLLGGRGGVLIDQRFLIGGGGASGWGTRTAETGREASIGFGYGGLLLGWWPMPEACVRPMLNLLIGGGGYEQKELVVGDLYRVTDRGGFMADGEIGLMIRLHQHVRLSLCAGWRSVATNDDLLNAPSLSAGIWLGSF